MEELVRARADLAVAIAASVSDRVRMALLDLPDDLAATMANAELSAFGPISHVDYDELRNRFAALGLDRIAG